METVYADIRMLRVSTFPGTRPTVPWIARMPRMSTSLVLDEATTYTFYGWTETRG
jgi:hypothetical protein